jgi:hypothetical protein
MSLTIKTGEFLAKDLNETTHVFSVEEIDPTDVTISDKAILSPIGIDPICYEVSVEELPFNTAGEMSLKLSLSLEGEWEDLDNFIRSANDNKDTYINLQHEPHAYKPNHSKLFMIGKADEIMELGNILRDGLISKQLEVDSADYPLVHPELIGQAMDKVSDIIAHNRNKVAPETAFSYGAYHHDWS